MPEDFARRKLAAGSVLTLSYLGKEDLRVGAPGQFDQLAPQVLLQRSAGCRRPRRENIAGLVRNVTNRDSCHVCIVLPFAAVCCRKAAALDGFETFWLYPIAATLGIDTAGDDAGLSQNPSVLGDRGLVEAHPHTQLADGPLSIEKFEHVVLSCR
jgi:hypothetical protein